MKNPLFEAFHFNLEAYDNAIINKQQFSDSMEFHITNLALVDIRNQIDQCVKNIKKEMKKDYRFDIVLPKNIEEADKNSDFDSYMEESFDIVFELQKIIKDKVDNWLEKERKKVYEKNNWPESMVKNL